MNFSFCHSAPFSSSVGTSMLGPMPRELAGRARAEELLADDLRLQHVGGLLGAAVALGHRAREVAGCDRAAAEQRRLLVAGQLRFLALAAASSRPGTSPLRRGTLRTPRCRRDPSKHPLVERRVRSLSWAPRSFGWPTRSSPPTRTSPSRRTPTSTSSTARGAIARRAWSASRGAATCSSSTA